MNPYYFAGALAGAFAAAFSAAALAHIASQSLREYRRWSVLYQCLDNLSAAERDALRVAFQAILDTPQDDQEALMAVSTALSRSDWSNLARQFASAVRASPEKRRRATHVLHNILANVRLRRYTKAFVGQFSVLMAPDVQREAAALSQRVEKIRQQGPRAPVLYRFVTRCFDIFFSTLVLVVCLPLGAALSSPFWVPQVVLSAWRYREWPLRRSKRLGADGRIFGYLEFNWASQDPSRVRRGLIEIGVYNLFNYYHVLIGTMALVGPYPVCCIWPVSASESEVKRFLVPPGMTGPAQLESYSRQLSWEEFVQKDVEFIENPSIRLYAQLFFKSLTMFLARDSQNTRVVEEVIDRADALGREYQQAQV